MTQTQQKNCGNCKYAMPMRNMDEFAWCLKTKGQVNRRTLECINGIWAPKPK